MLVKICGLKTSEALEAAISAGADMAGFVFFPKSPRHIDLDASHALGKMAAGRIKKVALLVDAADEAIQAVVAALQPDILQLHGRESPERVNAIQAAFGLPVMKACGISGKADIDAALAVFAKAACLLFDAKPPMGAVLPGGNGVTFDWRLLRGLKTLQPWMLSGGLDAANVAFAVATTGAAGVDVSSGVESAPGLKDAAKILEFVRQARLA